LVTDFAGLLSVEERDALEQKLLEYEDSTTTQIAIVIVESLQGYAVDQFAVELALKWKIGQKGKDNGILILVCPSERKMTIQTGYGIEARLPDGVAYQIIQEDMRPAFMENAFYDGLDAATTTIFKVLSGEYKAEQQDDEIEWLVQGTSIFVLFLMILFLFWVSRFTRGRGGSTIGGNRSRGFNSPTMYFPTGGGSSNWGGGSSGGGSFGGFGGGSFGGGGASGSW
jgi:uncharacterized protein